MFSRGEYPTKWMFISTRAWEGHFEASMEESCVREIDALAVSKSYRQDKQGKRMRKLSQWILR